MNLFSFNIPEEIAVAATLIILILVLKRFFWKPILKIIDERKQTLDDMLQNTAEAEKVIAEMEARLAVQDTELERMIVQKTKEARERAGVEYDRIIAEAQEKAGKIVEAGLDKADRLQKQALLEAQETLVSMALNAASVIVETSMDSEINRKLVEAILHKAIMRNG